MALTTGKTAAKFGISRTALLYYDKLGLVSPTARDANGYRLYSDEDQQRLRQVLLYRDVGVPLEQMPGLLAKQDDAVHGILFGRLCALNEELAAIKAKQLALIGIIGDYLKRSETPDEDTLTRLLASAGLDRDQAHSLHLGLEQSSPEAHVRFLLALGFGADEIAQIRAHFSQGKDVDHNERDR